MAFVRQPAIIRTGGVESLTGATAIFSRRIDYGLRALIYLAERHGKGSFTLQQICDDLKVPRAFMSKILQQLCRAQILRSQKGPSGGFLLAKRPEDLTVLHVVEQIEGPVRVFDCFSDGEDCSFSRDNGGCRILSVFDSVSHGIQQILGRVKLSDFCGNGHEPVPVHTGTPVLQPTGQPVA